MGLWLLTLVSGLSFSQSLHAEVVQVSSMYVLCKYQKTVRTIRVMSARGSEHCVVMYTKRGVDEIVGESRTAKSCQGIVENIRSNLEGGRWECRQIAQVAISASSEAAEQEH